MTDAGAVSGHAAGRRAGFSWIRALQIFAVVWACICVWQDIDNLARNAHLETDLGTMGVGRARSGPVPGYQTVVAVKPGGAAEKAGVIVGDAIRFDNGMDVSRRPKAGETIGATVLRNGQTHHAVITATARYHAGPLDWSFLTDDFGNAASTLIMALFGGFMALRSRGNLTTILLGLGLMTYGLSTYLPERSFSDRSIYVPALIAGEINLGSIPFLFHAFALNFYKDTVAPPKRWEWGLLAIYGIVLALLTAATTWYDLTAIPAPVFADGYASATLLSLFGFAAAFVYLFLGWRRSQRETQQRYALLLLAAGAVIVAQIASQVANASLIVEPWLTIVYIAQTVLTGVIAPPLFAYAILRHKVVDLGFAFNRTLVYTVVSFMILLAFGLAEWGIEKLLPEETLKANAIISAGIALVIFLVFHRIRDFVEHNIEKLFFRRWHQKEAELKRFVREAAFIMRRDPLVVAYVAAVKTFCDGADVALYLADDEGIYRRVEGGLPGQPDVLDSDNPFMVTLRADRTAFEPGAAIALVLPMIHRTEVIGATLLGVKPNGFGYRPDEKEVLAWAAHQIGLDLHALEVERLQQANASLTASNDVLSAKYNDLRDMTEGLLKGSA